MIARSRWGGTKHEWVVGTESRRCVNETTQRYGPDMELQREDEGCRFGALSEPWWMEKRRYEMVQPAS